MTGQAVPRGFYNGWPDGVVEQEAGDSKRLSRLSLASARNVRVDLTGGVYGRRGIAARAPGLWSTAARIHRHRGAAREALLACDGQNIRVLEYPGPAWTAVGAFTNVGTASVQSFAFMKGRSYVCNGADAPKVVEYAGGWNVRNAGVAAATAAATVTVTGSTSGQDIYFRHAFSHIDDRGFESNIGPVTTQSCRPAQSFTMAGFPAAPANVTHRAIYSTLQNTQELYFVAKIPVATTSYAYSNLNIDRDDTIGAPLDNNPPPVGVRALYEYRNRLFAAGRPGQPSVYMFSRAGEAEYWPTRFSQDTSVFGDPSDVIAFAAVATGLEIWKSASAIILEEDPEFTSGPRPLMQSGGLAARDAIVGLNGNAYALSQRGLLAHDGDAADDIFEKAMLTSTLALQAATDRVLAAADGVRTQFFFRNPQNQTRVRCASWDQVKRRWLMDELALATATATITDVSLDFSTDAHVAAHENLEVGAQTIASGGGTATPVLSGTNNEKLAPGVAIKFAGSGVFNVAAVSGQRITLAAGAAPADGTAVEWIRGTQVKNGVLTLYGV